MNKLCPINKPLVFLCLTSVCLVASPAAAALNVGLLSDFEDDTTDGWTGGGPIEAILDGGPQGDGDAYLRIGVGSNFASFNQNIIYTGTLNPAVTAIQVDALRPTGEADFDLRLVLFGDTNDRWTSSVAAVVPGDGQWNTYTFSVLEEDLTQVQGAITYSDLVGNIGRLMLRYDPDTPSPGGAFIDGTLGVDNVRAIGDTQGVVGDYSGDSLVDIQDYTKWRDNLAAPAGTLANDNTGQAIGEAQYQLWRTNFAASGAASIGQAAVPEPSGLLILLAACGLIAMVASASPAAD